MGNKTDQMIWYAMVTAVSIIILGGGAWAHNINFKVEKIAGIEANLEHVKNDLNEIKQLIKIYMKRGE